MVDEKVSVGVMLGAAVRGAVAALVGVGEGVLEGGSVGVGMGVDVDDGDGAKVGASVTGCMGRYSAWFTYSESDVRQLAALTWATVVYVRRARE